MKVVTVVLLACSSAGCASEKILRDEDYSASVEAYRGQDSARALEKFPAGEPGGFITSVERAWLEQWVGHWKPDQLAKQAETIERRQPVWLSDEARLFFQPEREHQYLPSEHEVVTMHLLHATHLLQSGNSESAHVELRRAALVLEQQWDDAGLRLWLAALWTAAGDWSEARVDLRRAHELGGDPRLQEWAALENPPPQLQLHFFGMAPDLEWSGLSHKPQFVSRAPTPPVQVASSTSRWFERHSQKDHVVRDFARGGHHAFQVAGIKTLNLTERVGAKTLAWGVRAAGVAVGVGLTAGSIYLLSKSGGGGGKGGELLMAGSVGAGYGIWKIGSRLDRKMTKFLEQEERRKQEQLKTYRLVRFLPEWIGLSTAEGIEVAALNQVALKNGVLLKKHR